MTDTIGVKEQKVKPEFESFHNTGVEIKPFYTPSDLEGFDYARDLGDPGQYPYTRGLYPEGYRERPWRKMQYAGYGVGEDTNARWKFLIAHGQRGLNLPFDLPTQLGLDSDDPRAEGGVGRTGVAIDTLDDMERMYQGIDIGEISSAYTINATANILLAMYVALAKKWGVPQEKLRGTLQNEIIKEHLARGMYIYPVRPAIKMTGDTIEYCINHMPRFNPVSISIHHLFAGATMVQTWAVMFLSAITYIEETMKRGYTFDQVAPLISFLHDTEMDFLANIAFIRALRRHWARIAKEQYGAKEERSMMLRVGTGVFVKRLTHAQPLNNLCRITVMALAAVLAGSNSMHLGSYDEAYAIPTEEATRLSLMIQNILDEETNIRSVVDPLGGSYFIETLTNQLEQAIVDFMADINRQGGILKLLEDGTLHQLYAEQSLREEQDIQSGKRALVGVNKYIVEEDIRDYEEEMFDIDPEMEKRQVEKLRKVKAERDNKAVEQALGELRDAAERDENLVPYLISAVEKYATLGEMSGVLKEVCGEYEETGVY